MARVKQEPISFEDCQRQIKTFGSVIGYYDINHTVKEATEIINNYEQAHTDDQVLIKQMDQCIRELKGELQEMKDKISNMISGMEGK
jgi:chromosome segregation ATPase